MTEFRLLGPVEAASNGETLRLPVGKPRALLARLLLDVNRVVPAETLIDSLWGDEPPASAHKLVQAYVSQLRKALPEDAIETRAPGYVIRRADTDVARFEALVADADDAPDPSRRVELLGRALRLFRGTPLAEFRDEPFARSGSRRLAELRLAALEAKLEAELELGRHERSLPQLAALVEEEPLRERPRRLLMLALYRSGRQAEALERYREGRRLLVDELGIEPGGALQELERAILRREPSLDDARPVGAGVRRGCVLCVGADVAPLAAPLCGDGRELLVVELAPGPDELRERAARLDRLRDELAEGLQLRTATFTSQAQARDLARLAADQDAELVVTATPPADGPDPPCDVAWVPRPELRLEPTGPIVVPFGGGRDEWPAVELGAWLARAYGIGLRLVGVEGAERDASRTLAGASIALQRFAGVVAETAIVAAGADGILAERGAAIVASLPSAGLGSTRQALVERAEVPLLLVRGGVRPSGLAPTRTLTRFSWSLP